MSSDTCYTKGKAVVEWTCYKCKGSNKDELNLDSLAHPIRDSNPGHWASRKTCEPLYQCSHCGEQHWVKVGGW